MLRDQTYYEEYLEELLNSRILLVTSFSLGEIPALFAARHIQHIEREIQNVEDRLGEMGITV